MNPSERTNDETRDQKNFVVCSLIRRRLLALCVRLLFLYCLIEQRFARLLSSLFPVVKFPLTDRTTTNAIQPPFPSLYYAYPPIHAPIPLPHLSMYTQTPAQPPTHPITHNHSNSRGRAVEAGERAGEAGDALLDALGGRRRKRGAEGLLVVVVVFDDGLCGLVVVFYM